MSDNDSVSPRRENDAAPLSDAERIEHEITLSALAERVARFPVANHGIGVRPMMRAANGRVRAQLVCEGAGA